MKTLYFYAVIFATIFGASSLMAEDISVEMLNKRDDGAKMVYSEDISTIEVGDSINHMVANTKRSQCRIHCRTRWLESTKEIKIIKRIHIYI